MWTARQVGELVATQAADQHAATEGVAQALRDGAQHGPAEEERRGEPDADDEELEVARRMAILRARNFEVTMTEELKTTKEFIEGERDKIIAVGLAGFCEVGRGLVFAGQEPKSGFWGMRYISLDRCRKASKLFAKAIAESAVGTIQGSSTTARKNDLKGRLRLSSSASHRPSANFRMLATVV